MNNYESIKNISFPASNTLMILEATLHSAYEQTEEVIGGE